MGLKLHHDRFPLIVVEFLAPFSDTDCVAFGDAMRALLARKTNHAIVFQPGGLFTLNAQQRAMMVALSKETAAESAKYVVCSCVIIDNPLARGVVTAINWISPPTFEQKFMATVEEAEAWALRRLAEDAAG